MSLALAAPRLDALAQVANAAHRAAEACALVAGAQMSAALDHALAAGDALARAKAQLAHGEWLPWLAKNFEGTVRAAQRYTQLAERREIVEEAKAKRASHLGVEGALRLLRGGSADGTPPALFSSKSNEWYTPARYVEAAREWMGAIDLDPASCAQANDRVRAARFFTAADDGLGRDWPGRVWLNPPYGRDAEHESNQATWSARLGAQVDAGVTTAAVLLVTAVTDRRWFAPLWARWICFAAERIKFDAPGGGKEQPTNGNALVGFGGDAERFVEIFSRFGPCVVPRGTFGEVFARRRSDRPGKCGEPWAAPGGAP